MEVLVLEDGNRGNFNQAMGIAERLPGARISTLCLEKETRFRPSLLATLAILLCALPLPAGKIRYPAGKILRRKSARKAAEKAQIVISTGRRLAPYNLLICALGQALSVQVLHPEYLPTRLFDLVVLPSHDLKRYRVRKPSRNMAVISGATGRIRRRPRPTRAARAGKTFKLAVLVGGEDKNYTLPPSWARDLCRRLGKIAEDLNATVMLATSRRTARSTEDVFREKLRQAPGSCARFQLVLAGETDDNPVGRFLEEADIAITTGDSVNMVSEAASSGCPTLVLPAKKKRQALIFEQALESLEKSGFLCLGKDPDPERQTILKMLASPPKRVLDETGRVSRIVAELHEKRAGAPK